MLAAKKFKMKGLSTAVILGAPIWGYGLGGASGLKLGLVVSGFMLLKLFLPYVIAYLRDHGTAPESKKMLIGAAGVAALAMAVLMGVSWGS